MSDQSAVRLPVEAERFLGRLEQALGPLAPGERQEIVDEIRSHLSERAAQGATELLAGFDDPEAYAATFVQERALAGALAGGGTWAVGRALLSGARRIGWWYLVLVLGVLHLYGAVFLLLAVLKPIFPAKVGLFVGGSHVAFGAIFGEDFPGRAELLGWWAIPLFVALGVPMLWGANWTLRALGRWRLARLRAAGLH